MMTFVALMALTTQAWAQGKLIYEKVFTSDTQYPFYLDAADKTGASATVSGGMLVLNNPTIQTQNWDVQPEIGRLTSATPITKGNTYRVVIYYKTTAAGGVTFALGGQDWTNTDWKGQSITVSDDFQTCEGYFDSFPYSNSESHILLQFGSLVTTITIKKVEVYELYPFTGITWDAAKKTATIAEMPTGNVSVTPEYYDLATLADKGLTAAEDAAATTEAPLAVVAENAVTGGTLMYYVAPDENFSQSDAIALAETEWNNAIPTAETFDGAGGTAYVWYYIKGDDEHSDTDPQRLEVTVQPEPTYTVEFAEGTPEPDKWTASPNADVKKGQTVTVTYTGTKKIIGVKAEKKSAFTPLDNSMTAWTAGTYAVPAGGLTYSDAITVSGDVTLVLTDGETLTLNKGISLAEGATLTIQGNGTMNVNGTNNSTASTVAGSGTITLTSGTLTAKGGNGGDGGAAGGAAINGTVIVDGGTLTATGGNGGNVGEDGVYSNGGAGGAAISGSVTVNSGTLTATGGNGGSVGNYSYCCGGGAGGAAISGDLTINSGTVTSTNGANGQLGRDTEDCSAGAGDKAVAGTVTDNR